MRSRAFTVRSTTEDDWRQVRDLRLEMLQDTPLAYLETYETALTHTEAEWRARARRGTNHGSASFAAIADDGHWVGMMNGTVFDGARHPMLVGVYVTPRWRGTVGVTDALLDAVENWARRFSDRLMLDVHEHNDRAIRAYERRGYLLTGATTPYPLDPTTRELEMIKQL